MKNTSGSSKYLWLWKIPLACPNTSGFEEFLMLISPTFSSYEHSSYFKYLQLWMTPAISNTSGYEKYLQLLITWESTFFLVESCLKGLVHSGSSCRSWTTLLLPWETWTWQVDNLFITEGRVWLHYTLYTQQVSPRGDTGSWHKVSTHDMKTGVTALMHYSWLFGRITDYGRLAKVCRLICW